MISFEDLENSGNYLFAISDCINLKVESLDGRAFKERNLIGIKSLLRDSDCFLGFIYSDPSPLALLGGE